MWCCVTHSTLAEGSRGDAVTSAAVCQTPVHLPSESQCCITMCVGVVGVNGGWCLLFTSSHFLLALFFPSVTLLHPLLYRPYHTVFPSFHTSFSPLLFPSPALPPLSLFLTSVSLHCFHTCFVEGHEGRTYKGTFLTETLLKSSFMSKTHTPHWANLLQSRTELGF